MGCHVWFSRKLTDEEFNLMKEYALTEVRAYMNEGIAISEAHFNSVKRSIETGEKCVDGSYWYDYHYGITNPKLPDEFRNNIIDVTNDEKLYIGVDDFHNVARVSMGVYTYPGKVIHNKKELRRYLGKRYFNITDEEHQQLTQFWRKYPGGILHWG